jgi:hypothetical protein
MPIVALAGAPRNCGRRPGLCISGLVFSRRRGALSDKDASNLSLGNSGGGQYFLTPRSTRSDQAWIPPARFHTCVNPALCST